MDFNKQEAILIISSILELRGQDGLIKILGKEKFNLLIKEIKSQIDKADKKEYVLHNINFLEKCSNLILNNDLKGE